MVLSPIVRILALLSPCLPMTSEVRAARPLQTEDTGVLSAAACEWQFAASRALGQGPAPTAWEPSAACGVAPGYQVGLWGSRAAGEGTAGVNAKAALWEDEARGLSLTLAGSLALWQDSGWRRGDLGIRLAAGWATQAGQAWLNLGHQRGRGPASRLATTWHAAWDFPQVASPGGPWGLAVETFGDDRAPAGIGRGLRWQPVEACTLDLGWAAQRGGERGRTVTVGMTWSLD